MPPVTTSYCTIATAGHVDHGKTALIKALTGINPDRLKEEQEREMTTDLGFAHLDYEFSERNARFVLGFIDVPGHGKFLKNMLAGVGGIESALLVVAADEGPMPQTVQHLKILSLLGVKSCVVAVTKIDLVSEEQIKLVEGKVKDLLAQFNLALLSLHPLSTVSGAGLDALKTELCRHFDVQALQVDAQVGDEQGEDSDDEDDSDEDEDSDDDDGDEDSDEDSDDEDDDEDDEDDDDLDSDSDDDEDDDPSANQADSQNTPRSKADMLFMPVDRVFTKSGYGLVATGTLVKGTLNTGDQINIEPGKVKARVRGMESFGKPVAVAEAGQRVAVNLAVKDGGVVSRGSCIVGEGRAVVHNLIVEIIDHGGLAYFGETVEDDDAGRKVANNETKTVALSPQPIKLYHGTAEAKGTLRWMEKVTADADSDKQYGQIFLEDPIVAEPGNRYVVRYGDDGIAGGAILLCDRPRWLTRQLVHDVSSALIENSAESNEKAFVMTVAAHPLKAVSLAQLGWFMPEGKLKKAAASAVKSGTVFIIADLYMAVATRDQIGEKILSLLKTLMTNEDNARFGVSIETMRKKTFNTLTRPVMQAIVANLAENELLGREGDRIFTRDDNAQSARSGGASGRASGASNGSTDGSSTGSSDDSGAGTEDGGVPLSAANVTRAVMPDDPDFSKTNRLRDKVLAILNQHPCLEIAEVAQQVNVDVKQLNLLLDALVKNKQVAIVDHDFVATTGKLRGAHQLLSKLWAAKQEITPGDFRQGMSTTRKYAMALLGYFDEKAITRRISGKRVLLKEP